MFLILHWQHCPSLVIDRVFKAVSITLRLARAGGAGLQKPVNGRGSESSLFGLHKARVLTSVDIGPRGKVGNQYVAALIRVETHR